MMYAFYIYMYLQKVFPLVQMSLSDAAAGTTHAHYQNSLHSSHSSALQLYGVDNPL